MKPKLRCCTIVLLCFLGLSAKSQEITESTFGNDLINVVAKDSSYSLKFATRFQTLFSSRWTFTEDDTSTSGETNMLIRRARLKFEGFAYSPKLEYKIELGLSNRDISEGNEFTGNAPRYILDAVLKWNFYKNFVLWAGQTKLPGNRERVISSGDLQLVDRSLLNSRYNIDRDIGVQLHHSHQLGENILIKKAISFSQGEGRNIISGNLGGFQYTGRLELFPFGNFNAYEQADLDRYKSPKLAVGFTFDHNNNAVRNRSNMGNYMRTDYGFHETDINTYFIDAMFKYRGLSIMGEYAKRNAESPIALNSNGTPTGDKVNEGTGINFQIGYLLDNNYELVGRVTHIDRKFQLPNNIENQYTIGLSKYIINHKLKIQTDISLNDMDHSITNRTLYRLQIDFHF